MQTRVAEMLGVEFPILAFSHCRDVVAAVTNSGGFGVLGAVGHTPKSLEIDLTWIDEQVHGRPYGLDLLLPHRHNQRDDGAPTIDADTLSQLLPAKQQEFVEEILHRYHVPELPGEVEPRVGSINVSEGRVGSLLDVAFGHPIRLFASALGDPPLELVERAHDAGLLVAALAGTAEHARRSNAKGVDLIVAQGTEAGGHTGTISTMVLIPEVVDAVAPTPVVAAGGIGRGSQIAAALALGAEGVWCGSLWLTTAEAETDPAVQQKFLAASSSDTVRSRSLTGKPARMLRQRVDRRVGGGGRAGHPADARPDAADRGGPAADQPPCRRRRVRGQRARDVLRGSDRRFDERRSAGSSGHARPGDRVRRRGHPLHRLPGGVTPAAPAALTP